MSKARRSFSGSEKMAILREHLIERVPISEVCEKHGVQPALFYGWQKKLFEEGAAIFAERDRKLKEARQRRAVQRAAARPEACGPMIAASGFAVGGLATATAERDNMSWPVKRKRALEASNPPGIAGRVCDEWSRGAEIAIRPPTLSHHSEHSLMPQKTQTSDGGMCARRVTLLSNSGGTRTRPSYCPRFRKALEYWGDKAL